MTTVRVSLLLAIVAAVLLPAQELAFEVASVKPSTLPGGGWNFSLPGEIMFRSEPLRLIIPVALDVPVPLQELKVVWAPATEKLRYGPRFDIHAKGDPTNDSKAMLRTLLQERFGLRTHTEVRQVPIYALTLKEPGKLGPWLKPTPHNCREYIARGGRKGDSDSPRQGDLEVCWPVTKDGRMFTRDGERVNLRAGTMQDLIELVAVAGTGEERPVIDATGLSGNFVWEVVVGPEPAGIFPAFEDQLGLKLERRTGPWEFIVIDHVQMPTPN